jgi:hypothetical protein
MRRQIMACVDNDCTQCDWFNVSNRMIDYCPECGARVNNTFDEDPDPGPDPDEFDGEFDDDFADWP